MSGFEIFLGVLSILAGVLAFLVRVISERQSRRRTDTRLEYPIITAYVKTHPDSDHRKPVKACITISAKVYAPVMPRIEPVIGRVPRSSQFRK